MSSHSPQWFVNRRVFVRRTAGMAIALCLPMPFLSFSSNNNMEQQQKEYDVIIIGGSYAGLSAAMALGRSLKRVLVIDAGKPCNRQTPHSQNFLTQDGTPPQEISSIAKAQVMRYDTVTFFDDTALSGKKIADGFEVTCSSGEVFKASKLIFATGLKDNMPDIKGFAECWGISAIHCPYCHGYEHKGKPTGLLLNGDMAYHLVQLVSNLTNSLTVFTNGKPEFKEGQLEKIKAKGVRVVEARVTELVHEGGYISEVICEDGNVYEIGALYARPDYEQHCKIPEQLGCMLNEQGLVKTDMFQKTTVEGTYAAGDCAAMRAVAMAVATGNMAGAVCNKELTEERF